MPTKAETIEALRDAIRHWEENCQKAKNHTLERCDILADKCALCSLFLINDCKGCPLKEIGRTCCVDWENVAYAIHTEQWSLVPAAAEDMLATLEYKLKELTE